jgi:hypothetical protein
LAEKGQILRAFGGSTEGNNMINEHESRWLGFSVREYTPKRSEEPVEDADKLIYRLTLDWDSDIEFPELFARFVSNPACAEAPAIIIGQFFGDDPEHDSSELVRLLVSARQKLAKLRGIFLGDLIVEESEISWIQQSDVSPLFDAYPQMEHFRVRGSEGLAFGALRHQNLKSLVVESGGLPPEILRQLASCQFPALEHFEVWLGTSSYGGDATVNDLWPFLQGTLFPKLRRLGLRDSEIADEIAQAIVNAPVLDRIEALDLSLGTLSDRGASALLGSLKVKRLRQLDLHRHYISNEMMAKLRQAFPNVDVSDQQKGEKEDDRYVAVSE